MNSQEKDFLSYTGNKVPRVIRLAWTVLIIFCVVYLAIYAFPDLSQWMQKTQ